MGWILSSTTVPPIPIGDRPQPLLPLIGNPAAHPVLAQKPGTPKNSGDHGNPPAKAVAVLPHRAYPPVKPVRPLPIGTKPAASAKVPPSSPVSPVPVPQRLVPPKVGVDLGSPAPVSRQGRAVIAAITRGVDFLLAHEHRAWLWETGPNLGSNPQYGGKTALVTEALLDVQQSLNLPQLNLFSPKMRRAINFVARIQPRSTYVASFQANAMALLPGKQRYQQVLQKDARYLIHSIHHNGGYTYMEAPPGALVWGHQLWDNSNTQYGILGIWACAHSGVEIPFGYWLKAVKHWRRKQYADGAWSYSGTPDHPAGGPGDAPCNTMTPAGVASLLICDEYLNQRATVYPVAHPFVLRGLTWLHKHFNPRERNFYAMYGDERVALASGIQTIGGHNWYHDFAATLVAHHGGPWRKGRFPGATTNISTAYALLVLDRGLNPVVINKLQYQQNFFGDWNARQRDVANFTSWLSGTFETPLNWQVVNINSPLRDWLDAPILFITGREDPHFSPQQVAKLRQYVQAGGLVLAAPEGYSKTFQTAMMHYAQQVGGHQYKVKPVPATSYIYTMQPWYQFKHKPPFMAVRNHLRYLWIISSVDLGAVWQSRQHGSKEDWQIPANIYLYATGKAALSDRLESLAIKPPTQPLTRSLGVAELRYVGNWNPEPGAWPRMAQIAATDFHTHVTVQTVAMDNKLNARQYALAHLTGTGTLALTPTQIQALRGYLDHGGMLLVDAAGGKNKFTDSFVKLAALIYPHHPLQHLPSASSLFAGAFPDGLKISHVQYRKFYNQQHHRVQTRPGLLGIKWHGRWVVVFSPADITSGLLGTNTWGISGYAPVSAQALARDVMLYAAAHQHK